jgi:GT2 family glycosyltransferase
MLSLVTATKNGLAFTRAYWESLLDNPPPEPWEIVWVDDASTDGTREWLRSLPAPRHRVLFNETGAGFGAANNRGARHACGDTLALLNNDLVLTPGWFPPMMESLDRAPGIGVVGNIQLDARTRRVDHAGVCFNLAGTGEHHLRGARELPAGPGAFYPAATAACWLIRRELFLAHGGFDEGYHNGCEDLDFCLRLARRGLRHWVDYRSVVYHHVGASRGRTENDGNLRRFLRAWGDETARLGRSQWARHYLRKYSRAPWRYNPAKFIDALARAGGLRRGDSKWAARQRRRLSGLPAAH